MSQRSGVQTDRPPDLVNRLLSRGDLPHVPDHFVSRPPEARLARAVREKLSGRSLTPNVIVVHGPAGLGKTTLVARVLQGEHLFEHKTPIPVISASFAGQGRIGITDGPTPTDLFFADALRFFGADPVAAANDREGQLVRHLRTRAVLLVLDGLEAVHREDGRPAAGFRYFLNRIAENIAGMCIVTSRDPVNWLTGAAGVIRLPLDPLSERERSRLLRAIRETPSRSMPRVGERLPDTPLGIELFAGLEATGGKFWNSDQSSPDCPSLADVINAHLDKLDPNGHEWQLLAALSLFDEPIAKPAIEHLHGCRIPGLTAGLPPVDSDEWNRVLALLRAAYLVAEPNPVDADRIAIHPEIRHHVAERHLTHSVETWRSGHRAVAEHYRSSVTYRPDRLHELRWLFKAVEHLCLAGDYETAYHDVYTSRIARGTEDYARRALAANGEIAHALAFFFHPDGRLRTMGMAPPDELALRQSYAFALWVSDLPEARRHLLLALAVAERNGLWKDAARLCLNLGYHDLLRGQLDEAAGRCRAGARHARRAGDHRMMWNNAAALGCVLTYQGRDAEAAREFRRAGPAFTDRDTSRTFYPHLFFAEHLLARGKADEVLSHFDSLPPEQIRQLPLDIALFHLTKGRAVLAAAGSDIGVARTAAPLLQAAIDDFRRDGSTDELPRAELAMAEFHLRLGEVPAARLWIALARETIEPFELDLLRHEADCLEVSALLAGGDIRHARRTAELARQAAEDAGFVALERKIVEFTKNHLSSDNRLVSAKQGRPGSKSPPPIVTASTPDPEGADCFAGLNRPGVPVDRHQETSLTGLVQRLLKVLKSAGPSERTAIANDFGEALQLVANALGELPDEPRSVLGRRVRAAIQHFPSTDQAPDEHRTLTITQAAKILGRSIPLVKRLAREGRIGALLEDAKHRKRYYFSKAELIQFKKQDRRAGRPPAA